MSRIVLRGVGDSDNFTLLWLVNKFMTKKYYKDK